MRPATRPVSILTSTAQATLLSDQQTLATIQVEEMTSAVFLIEALGGGWDRSQLPTPSELGSKAPKSETTLEQKGSAVGLVFVATPALSCAPEFLFRDWLIILQHLRRRVFASRAVRAPP